MSEEQRITSLEKEKDPRRVEAGKKLGAISKAAKERKALERERYACEETPSGSFPDLTTTVPIITLVGVTIAGICLYYTYKQDKRESVTTEPAVVTKPVVSRIRSLD